MGKTNFVFNIFLRLRLEQNLFLSFLKAKNKEKLKTIFYFLVKNRFGHFGKIQNKTGFPDSKQTGFPDSKHSGFPDSRQIGFPDSRHTGFPDFRQTGFPDSRQTGFPDSKQTGFQILICPILERLGTRKRGRVFY